MGATEVEVKDRRLKKYRVVDTVVVAEKEQEAKREFTQILTNILKFFRPQTAHQEADAQTASRAQQPEAETPAEQCGGRRRG